MIRPTEPDRRRRPCNKAGFTLIEMIISLLIVAILMGASIPLVNSMANVYQKTAAQKMAGNIKFLYDRAILERIYIRLVIDLDSGQYWAESTKDPFFLSQKPLTVEEGAIVIEEDDDEEEEDQPLFDNEILFDDPENYKWQGWSDFANKFKKKKAAFSTYQTDLSKRTSLPKEVKFFGVHTESVDEAVTTGKVNIHLFPNGNCERAVIWLVKTSDLEDIDLTPMDYEIYSIMVQSLTGRSSITDSQVDLPEEQLDEEDW